VSGNENITVGFDEEFAKEIEEEISGYFICIVDAAIACMMLVILPVFVTMNS